MTTFGEIQEADLEIQEEPASRSVYLGMLVLSGLGFATAAALAAQEVAHRWQTVGAFLVGFGLGVLLYVWVQRESGVLGAQRHLCFFMALVAWVTPCLSVVGYVAFMLSLPRDGIGALVMLFFMALVGPYVRVALVGATALVWAAFRRLRQYELSGGKGGPATLMLMVVPMLAILMPLAGAWEKAMRQQREAEAVAAAQAAERAAAEAAERRGQGRPGEAQLSPEARQAADPGAHINTRSTAVHRLLNNHPAEKATDDLLWLLNDPEVREQLGDEICQKLGEIATPRAKRALLEAITRFPEWREFAAAQLAYAECFECIPELVRLLDGPSRVAAVRALGKLRAWEATPALIRAAERARDDRTRGWTVDALAEIGGPQAARAVLRAVKKFHGRLGAHDEEILVRIAKERAHLDPPRRGLYAVE